MEEYRQITKEPLINQDELGYSDKIGKEIEVYLVSGESLAGILKGVDKKVLIIETETDKYTEEILINTVKIKYINYSRNERFVKNVYFLIVFECILGIVIILLRLFLFPGRTS